MPRPEVFSPHCLKLAAWPALHQAAWHLAFAEAGLFEQPKPAARWRPASIHKTRAGYGVYLSWLDYRGYLVAAAPGTLVTRELVRAYIDELRPIAAPNTLFCRIQELHDAIRVMAPDQDWGWLLNAVKSLRSTATPVRNKLPRLQPASHIEALGLALMREAEDNPDLSRFKQALMYRDGLILAILIRRPLRLKNVCGMELGSSLILGEQAASLVFSRDQMKGKRPFEAEVPVHLLDALRTYIEVYRPYLMSLGPDPSQPATSGLWISSEGRPMAEGSLRNAVKKRTAKAFGRDLSPHLFRDCSVTTLVRDAPASARLTRAILSHTSLETTNRHYNQARMVETSRRHTDLVEQLMQTGQTGNTG